MTTIREQLKSTTKRKLASRPAVYLGARRVSNLARWAAHRPHEPEFEFYRTAPRASKGRVFLDVGANTGLSALCFRIYDRQTPVVSVEPNPMLERDLKLVRRLISGFEYYLVGAGEQHRETILYIPCYRGTPLTGEAALDRPAPEDVWWIKQNVGTPKPGDFSVIEQPVEVIPLDQLRIAPAHVKIDVEGSELEVLRGMRHTLIDYRPTILLERSQRLDDMRDWLRDAGGYEPMSWRCDERRLVPFDPSIDTQNVFFIARERPLA